MRSGKTFAIPSDINNQKQTNKQMKSIQRSLLISLVPFLTPLTAFAETDKYDEGVIVLSGAKGHSESWRASQVMGLNVKNASDETIGDVKDIVLDMTSGEVLAVIISSGGFLGMGDTLSAVPVSVLRYDGTAKALKISLTKEQLRKAPHFKGDKWPDHGDATSREALRSYRDSLGSGATAPDNATSRESTRSNRDSTRGDATAPDNSAQNKKEMRKDAVTAAGQGNSAQDVQITKNIRSGIMDTDLSFNAKNIKIITRNENVTLKGVVKSHDEHQAILKIANKHAKADRITDELKVNPD